MTDNISQELKYDAKVNSHSSIQYRNVAPQAAGNITISQVSATGPSEFVLSPACFNPSLSRLEFTLELASYATKVNFIDANLLTTISRMVVYDSATNAVILDCSNFEKYASLMVPLGTSFVDFMNKAGPIVPPDNEAAAQLDSIEDISKEILAGTNYTGVGGTNPNTDLSNMNIHNSLFGRKQFLIAAATAASFVDVSIPFSAFKGTFLNTNKVIYSPSNLVIQIYWNSSNNYAFGATAGPDPAVGAASLTTSPIIKNLNLALACESNLTIISEVMKTVMNNGITFQIPYPTVTRQNIASSSAHSYSLNLTKAYGNQILYLLTAPFNASGAVNLNNVHIRGAVATYNTFLNNVAIKYPAGFNARRSEDYILGNKAYTHGGVVQNAGEYINGNWFHCDSFFGEKGLSTIDYHALDGLDVGAAASTWQIQCNLSADTPYVWITIIQGLKNVSFTSMGTQVM
jgi:hypothetical protein